MASTERSPAGDSADHWLEPPMPFRAGTPRVRGARDTASGSTMLERDEPGIGIASAIGDLVDVPSLSTPPSAPGRPILASG